MSGTDTPVAPRESKRYKVGGLRYEVIDASGRMEGYYSTYEISPCANCSGTDLSVFHPCEKCGTRQCMVCRWPYEWYFCKTCKCRYCQNCVTTSIEVCADCENGK